MARPCTRWAHTLTTTHMHRLSSDEREALRLHLRTCRACFTLYSKHLAVNDYLKCSLPNDSHLVTAPPAVTPAPLRMWPLCLDYWRRGRQHLSWRRAGILVSCVGLLSLLLLFPLILELGAQGRVQAASLSLRQKIQEPRSGTTWIHTVAWSPNGTYIAVLWDDSMLQISDASTGKEVFSQEVGWGYGLAWSPDSQFLASIGRDDNTVAIWNVSTHHCEPDASSPCLMYTQHTAQVVAIAWSPDGQSIASASDDGTVQVWDAQTLRHRFTYQASDAGAGVTAVAWSPDGKRLVSGESNGHIQAWDAFTGGHLMDYIGHTGAITSLSWSSDGASIASASYDGRMRIWESVTGLATMILSPCNGSPVLAALWTPYDSPYLALACYDSSVQIRSVVRHQGKLASQLIAVYPTNDPDNGVFTIAWSPRGNQLIAGGRGNILAVTLGE